MNQIVILSIETIEIHGEKEIICKLSGKWNNEMNCSVQITIAHQIPHFEAGEQRPVGSGIPGKVFFHGLQRDIEILMRKKLIFTFDFDETRMF